MNEGTATLASTLSPRALDGSRVDSVLEALDLTLGGSQDAPGALEFLLRLLPHPFEVPRIAGHNGVVHMDYQPHIKSRMLKQAWVSDSTDEPHLQQMLTEQTLPT